MKKEAANKLSNRLSGLSLVGLIALPEVGLALIGASLVSGTYSVIPSKEERVLNLVEEGSRQLERLTKSIQKDINKDITEREVLGVIQEGLDSGLYCQNFPELYGRRDIKKQVSRELKARYSTR